MPDQNTMTRQRAVGMLLVVAVLWSLGGILIKNVDWPPLALAGGRSVIAAAVAWAFLRRPRFTWSGPQLGGAAAYASTVILFVVANKYTTAANAILLQYTSPIWVAVFGGWFIGERPTRRDWLTLLAVMGGIGLFFLDRLTVRNVWGNLAAIGSGLGFAWLAIFVRQQKQGSSLESVILGNLLTFIIGLPFMFSAAFTASNLAGIAVLGVVQLGFSYVLFTIASRNVSALDLILIPAIEPVLNPLWVLLLAGEVPGPWSILGGLVVLASVTVRGILIRNNRPRAA